MGYRKYASEYEIEYVQRLDKKRPQAVRIYVGPYFVFEQSPETVKRLKLFYLAMTVLTAALLIIPMCIDCGSTRTWYVQLPSAFAWIGWALCAFSLYALCTAKEKMEREQNDGIHQRMSGASLSVLALCALSTVGSVIYLVNHGFGVPDALVLLCNAGAALCAGLMFSRRAMLKTRQVENPEKPQAKKQK